MRKLENGYYISTTKAAEIAVVTFLIGGMAFSLFTFKLHEKALEHAQEQYGHNQLVQLMDAASPAVELLPPPVE